MRNQKQFAVRRSRKRYQTSIGGIFVCVGICILLTLFCFQYYKNLHLTLKEESTKYLQEVANRIGSNINRIIEDNFNVLHTMAAALESVQSIEEEYGIDELDEMKSMLQKQSGNWNYKSLLLIDKAGRAYDLDNNEVVLNFDDAVRKEILSGHQSLSTTQIVNNEEYIFFMVPVQKVNLGEKEIIALAAGYAPSYFGTVLSMDAFGKKAHSQIVSKSGTVVVRTTSEYAMKTGYNVFTTLQNSILEKGGSVEKIRQDIINDENGQITFELNGEKRYMVYTPIQPDEWYLLTFVPLSVVNEKTDILLRTTLYICGFVSLAFIILSSILLFSFNSHKKKLEYLAYVDEVTGGNTIQKFYALAKEILNSKTTQSYALIYTNIEKFRVLNEQIGRQNCNAILKLFNQYITETLENGECTGRIASDNFCILMKYTDQETLLERFRKLRLHADQHMGDHDIPWSMPVIQMGVYVLDDYTLSFPVMIDRAKMALKESKIALDSKFHYSFYDDKARRQLFREKQIEDMMEAALAQNEFVAYLQPKYHLPEEKVGGAEALVRWISPTEGMIYPDEFIPLFEKNGFIIRLDLWVFEEVCRTLQKWKNQGLPLVKISVNCSRVHFKTDRFLEPYIRIVNQYDIERKFLEIELTESVVFENSDQLIGIIQRIREEGFGCSMDDFGSGYSSLNLIQSIPVDTLKLDRIFFKTADGKQGRTEAVIKSMVSMAKELSMEVVAEGVECRDQVEMLKRDKCDYIQGYVFAKPMEISAFELLTFGRNIQ